MAFCFAMVATWVQLPNLRQFLNWASDNLPSIAIDIPGHGKSYFNNIDESYDYKDFRSELYLILQQIA